MQVLYHPSLAIRVGMHSLLAFRKVMINAQCSTRDCGYLAQNTSQFRRLPGKSGRSGKKR
jgi:hypothetical protein